MLTAMVGYGMNRSPRLRHESYMHLSAQDTVPGDSVRATKPTVARRDSAVVVDSLHTDSIKSKLTGPMDFKSTDSIVIYPKRNLVRMYGKAEVKFDKQILQGDYMHMQTDSGTIYSTYIDYPDSLKKEKMYAKITNGDEKYEAKSITYNLNSQRGYITDVVTQQGDGYITAERTKRMENNDLYMQNGFYTTCDKHDHPHFGIALTKAKVRPDKDVVTGPAYMVLADVPLPIGLPFAFFPFTKNRASGIVVPTYGDEMDRGFYLRNGGYYWAINDYLDLELTGDIYTKGSWGVSARSTYRKRYRYSGSLSANYIVTKRGDKVAGDFSKATDFRIAWTHAQDPKANPYRTFSASVNFSTSSYNHNDLNSLYQQAVMGQNTKSSSISFSQRFPNSPWSITGSFDIAQRSQDSTIAVTLPNLSVNMSRIFPFKRQKPVGKERWYEKISVSYSGQFRNSYQNKESKILHSNFIKDWTNGAQHNIPISASFDLFNYFKVTPSINYTERWYTNRVTRAYDPDKNQVIPVDTTYGFNRVYDYNASLSLSTTIYGFFQPMKWVPWVGKNVSMIRHRVEPSVSLSYRPDFGRPMYGYWEQLNYIASDGRRVQYDYSPYEGQLFGVPGRGKNGSINFSVNNNVEAKVVNKKDSVGGFRKVSLIDNLSLSTSYNFAADSFQWSDLSASLSLRLSDQFTLRLGGAFDLYLWDYHEYDGRINPYRVNKLRVLNGKGLGRFRGTSTSFSYTLNEQSLNKILGWVGLGKKEGSNDDKDDKNAGRDAGGAPPGGGVTTPAGVPESFFTHNSADDLEYDAYGYSKNKIDWSLSFNYNLSLAQAEFNTKIKEFDYKLRHDLSFNGNLNFTKNWQFNFSANYNFEQGKITNMTCNITRNLHCWSMTASFIPIGPFKSYHFTIGVNSQLLQDLRYQLNSHPSYTNLWY